VWHSGTGIDRATGPMSSERSTRAAAHRVIRVEFRGGGGTAQRLWAIIEMPPDIAS